MINNKFAVKIIFPDGHKATGRVVGLKLDWPKLSIKVHGAHLTTEISGDLATRILNGSTQTIRL